MSYCGLILQVGKEVSSHYVQAMLVDRGAYYSG